MTGHLYTFAPPVKKKVVVQVGARSGSDSPLFLLFCVTPQQVQSRGYRGCFNSPLHRPT